MDEDLILATLKREVAQLSYPGRYGYNHAIKTMDYARRLCLLENIRSTEVLVAALCQGLGRVDDTYDPDYGKRSALQTHFLIKHLKLDSAIDTDLVVDLIDHHTNKQDYNYKELHILNDAEKLARLHLGYKEPDTYSVRTASAHQIMQQIWSVENAQNF